MAEPNPQDLQNRIALLKGQIQKHKESSDDSTYRHPGATSQSSYKPSYAYPSYSHHSSRYPYQPVRNKSLVINKSTISSGTEAQNGSLTVAPATNPRTSDGSQPSWIATTSRNAQIINSAAYNPAAARDRVLDPAAKIRKQAQAIRQKLSSGELRDRHLTLDGIKYSVQAGGSKLVRIKGSEDTLPTPKQVVVSGITFLRSKNGNLYRASVVKRNWYDNEVAKIHDLRKHRNSIMLNKKTELCKRFSNTGTCSYGPKCPYIHDASKIAICREFLRSGTCSQGQHCDLSHDLTYERVPACVHFDRGGCNKDNCPYPHVRINPAATVCRVFTTFGYCSKGVECQEKHVFECPDYAEGKCLNPKCRLPHVDRASRQTKQPAINLDSASRDQSAADSMATNNSNKKSANQTPLDSGSDIDSDDEVMMDSDGTGFSQEQDFYKF